MRHAVVRLAVLIGLVGMPSAYAAQPGTRESDGAGTITRFEFHQPHTTIRFSAEFLGILKVEGRFNDFYGSFLYNEDDFTQSSLHVVVLSSSVDSNAGGRDRDLRSDRFLDVIRFPGATFHSKGIEARGDGYVALGDLTIRDVTKEIEVPFKITGRTTWFSGVRLMGIEAGFTFNRQDFGMAWEQIIDDGSLFAGNEVRIDAKVGLAEVQANELDAEETYPAVTLSEAALRRFTGTYVQRDPAQEIQVALIGGHLVAQMQGDGQTAGFYPLVPIGGAAFRVPGVVFRGLGFLRFRLDGDAVQGVTFEQQRSGETQRVDLTWVLTFEGFQKTIVENVQAAVRQYHAFKRAKPAWFAPFDEREMNRLGRHYLREEKFEEAIAIFKLNVEEYPDSWNVYDSLAEAYLAYGNRDLAVQNYQKALDLNPDDEGLRERQESAKGE